MTCGGTVYTYAQLETLWIQAGGSRATAPVAAAIAEAESSGCSDALNLTDNNGTQTSVGLWQVSNGTHQYPASWLTASGNASEAVAKYKAAGGFSPWGTYNSGAYRPFVSNSTTPAASLPAGNGSGSGAAPGPGSGTGTGSSPAACLFGFPGFKIPVIGSVGSFCLFSKAEARAIIGGLLMVTGGSLVVIGALILAAGAFQRSGAQSALAGARRAVPFTR